MHAPHLLDVEVAQVMRRYASRGDTSPFRGTGSIRLLEGMPISGYPHGPPMARVWAPREHLSAYDATCVALAEALQATPVTTDRRMAGAPGIRTVIDVIA